MSELKEALSSLDQYGSRIDIIPAEVRGKFRTRRVWLQIILLLVFLILPWTRMGGNQTFLVDIIHRRFIFFGVQFWSHDGPLIFFIFAIIILSLALMTALWGRVWCGWACPQTVFIDGVYRRIEQWVEGNYIARRKLKQQPMSFSKALKWIAKWGLFLLVSSIIAHSFIAYFSGSRELISMMTGSPTENWSYFLLVSGVTGGLLFNFGWFREQFCIVVCPYGRFQSVLLDSNSVTVLYDQKRGEPRKNSVVPKELQGDCVSCNRCVQVCPTGIDIRKGVQMECIACTACIDACDEIMEKVEKPKGLIRYASLREKPRYFRPRILIYAALLVTAIGTLGFNFFRRAPNMVTVLRAVDMPFQTLKTGDGEKILNHFRLHLHNQVAKDQTFEILIPKEDIVKGVQLTMPQALVTVPALESKEVHFFVIYPHEVLNEKGGYSVTLQIHSSEMESPMLKVIHLIGPQRAP